MAGRLAMKIALAFTVATVALWPEASAQTSSCTPAILSLSPCLGYITGNSSTPSASCCTQLTSVVQTQAQCLCSLVTGGAATIGLSINQTQALSLPGACKIKTPPLSQCNATASGPATAPAPALAPSRSSAPAGPLTPLAPNNPAAITPLTPSSIVPAAPTGPSGSKTTPSTQSSDGSSSKSSVMGVFLLAACISLVTSF